MSALTDAPLRSVSRWLKGKNIRRTVKPGIVPFYEVGKLIPFAGGAKRFGLSRSCGKKAEQLQYTEHLYEKAKLGMILSIKNKRESN